MVEDVGPEAAHYARSLSQLRPTVVANTRREAHRALHSHHHWSGFLVDIGLPDGCGLDLMERWRPRFPSVPLVFETGSRDPAIVNRIYRLQGRYLLKPFDLADVVAFGVRCAAAESDVRPRIAAALEEFTRTYGLTASEADILLLVIDGLDHSAILRKRGIKLNTLKSEIRGLLRKLDVPWLESAALKVLRIAIRQSESRDHHP